MLAALKTIKTTKTLKTLKTHKAHKAHKTLKTLKTFKMLKILKTRESHGSVPRAVFWFCWSSLPVQAWSSFSLPSAAGSTPGSGS